MLEIGDLVADKFRIERVLGRGGMGCVMAARHVGLGHQVAIKILVPELCQREEAVARFLREARAAASLLSEHVARVLDVGTLGDGAPFMLMELLEGRDLARELDEGALAIRDTVDCVLQVCEALAEAHTLGIVHRDLKPANLFRERRADGSVLIKVLDFGISNTLPADPTAASLPRWTDTQSFVGSPQYMSPEQVRDPKTVDPRSDVWSLGVILYELLTGFAPFASDNPLSVLAAVIADEPLSIRSLRRDVSIGLEQVILKCLDKRPSARYATVLDLAMALATHTPTGEAAVERILAIIRSADERAPAGRQRNGSNASTEGLESKRAPTYVATLESPRPREKGRANMKEAWGEEDPQGPVLARRLRRWAPLLTGAIGALFALFYGECVAGWRSGGDSSAQARGGAQATSSTFGDFPAASNPPSSALTTMLTARMVAERTQEPELRDPVAAGAIGEHDVRSISTQRATSLRALVVTSSPASHSIFPGAKDGPPKPAASALGPTAVEVPADPLEGRE